MKESFTFSEFIRLCIKKKYWFILSVAACLLLATAYLVRVQPKYTRKAQILVRDEGGMGGLMGQLGGLAELGGFIGFGSSNVYNELYAMQSPWLLLNVVNQMHLDMNYTIKGIRNKDLYDKTLPVTVTFKSITEEDDVRMKLDLKRNGDFKIYKLKKNDDKYSDEVTGHVNSTVKSPIGDIEVKATPYLPKMEDDEVTITVTRTEPMAVVDRQKRSLNMVVSSRDASIIEIKCKDVSKQRATDIINAVIAEYRKESNEDQDAQAAVSERYVVERLASLESELKTLDNRVAEYKSKTLMPDLEVMAKAYADGAKDISQAQMEMKSRLYMVESIRDYLRDESKKDELLPALLITEKEGGLGEQVQAYNTVQLQRSKIIASSSKESPLVKDLDKQLSAMHDAVLASAENAIKQLKLQLKSVMEKENEGRQLLATAPKKAIGGLTDERDWKVLNEVYIFLLQKREEAQMAKAMKTDVRVVTPPLGVKKQTSPVKSTVILGAFLLGLFFPACAIFIRERHKR